MDPNAAFPKLPLGSFNGGVLDTLNASARNSRFARSVIRNVLPIIRSAFWSPGPRTGLRELLPITNCGAAVNAAVLKYLATLRLAKSFGLLIRFGRCTANPRPELLLVAWVTATVSPAWRRTKPPICQPAIFQRRGMS